MSFMDVVESYPENVREQMCRAVMETGDRLMRLIERDIQYALEAYGGKTESPLEIIFLAWFAAHNLDGWWQGCRLTGQREIDCGSAKYRADYTITCQEIPECRLVVELDGHEFHEKTKEQVALRNQRDRNLQVHGWTVFHFSGTELYADPEGCCVEILGFLDKWRGSRTSEGACAAGTRGV